MKPDLYTIFQAILENDRNLTFAVDRNYQYITFNEKYRVMMKEIYGIEIKPGISVLSCVLSEGQRKKLNESLDRAFAGESFIIMQEPEKDQPSQRIYEHYYFPLKKGKEIFGAALVTTDISEEILVARAKEEYIKELEKMMYKTSHKLRQPIAQILGLAQVINFEKNSPEEIKNILKLFKVSATKLDQFTMEMAKFIYSFVKKRKSQKSFFETEKCIETL